MKKTIPIALLLASAVLVSRCKKEAIYTVDCVGAMPTYNVDVKPIMDANCAITGCHNAATKKEGYDLSNYEGTKAAAGNLAFRGAIQHKSGYTAMPKKADKLSDADIRTVTCWVQNGMPQ
jgi:cytochrome c553